MGKRESSERGATETLRVDYRPFPSNNNGTLQGNVTSCASVGRNNRDESQVGLWTLRGFGYTLCKFDYVDNYTQDYPLFTVYYPLPPLRHTMFVVDYIPPTRIYLESDVFTPVNKYPTLSSLKPLSWM